MYRFQMKNILGKIQREQAAIDRYDKRIDEAFKVGDHEKIEKLGQIRSNLVHHRNGFHA